MDDKEKNNNSFIPWSILFVVFMVLVTIFYFNYDFPNKDENHIESFFWIFSREIIAALFLIVVLLGFLIAKVHKYLKNNKDKK